MYNTSIPLQIYAGWELSRVEKDGRGIVWCGIKTKRELSRVE